MKTSIATVSLSGTLGEKLEAVANAKFDAVEIFENDLITFNGAPADVRRACAELGLDIVTLQPFRDFEGMPPGRRERAMERAERKFDVMQELGTDLSAIRAIPGDRIFLVQLADAPLLQMDYLSWSRHFRNFPGQGELPVLDFMEALTATGYDGALSLEIFNDQFRAGSARSLAVDGHRSLRFLLDQLAERTGKRPPGVPVLPPRSQAKGVGFIEFSADDDDASRLEELLAGLGFRRAGRHRSKAVTRWSQGGINLVVNREKEGFAHSFNIVHGSAVCALGLTVDDAAATFQRATLLLDPPFRQAVGPGELDIPAVRGVGGSLVYFLDSTSELGRVWDIEFDDTGERGSDAGLTNVDHISQSMQYEEMLTWLLFYTSLLDLKKIPPQEVADPGGLVRSQVVESSDGGLRIVLNASQSQRTQSSRFLTELFGSGVQHIALATDDLLATVKQLEQNGVRLLAIPENYYDDLLAKTDLPADQLAMMKAHNILYDREGSAEYLQVYTETYDQRFFFEIVQRRGYRGYGAANAPVRLAAQARLSADDAVLRAS